MALPNTNAWWAADKTEGLKARIAQIQRINDPTTNADEILKASKVLTFILLLFTGLLGGLSYYKNFSGAFPAEAAIFMALSLTFVIEWGKNYATLWTLRIPFFRGFGHLISRPENTFVWVGLLCIGAATFYMSVYNSTVGGRQLATMLSHERNTVAFKPDTREIDAQIASTQKGIEANQAVKWKGTTTYTAQKAIAKQSDALTSLQRQREATISAQRADFEKLQGRQEANTNYTASLVLASGGWIELIQALLWLLRVSCEKSLDSRAGSPSPAPSSKPGIGFRQQEQFATARHYSTDDDEHPEELRMPRRPIGFHSASPPPVTITGLPTVPGKNPVEQCSPKEQPENSTTTPATVLADLKYWEKRARQCFDRYYTQQREEKRMDNKQRCECYLGMLSSVGVLTEVDFKTQHLKIEHPQEYRFEPWSIGQIEANKKELLRIGKTAYA